MKRILHFLMLAVLCFGFSEIGYAQQRITVRGQVIDAVTEEGLPGVNVVEKGTQNGITTDLDGNYSLQVDEGALIEYSFVGYVKQEAPATSETINISLNEDVAKLEEVVISGLASSVKRSNLANAIGTVSGEQLVGTTSQSTLDGALYGKIPGVNIVASSGAPGGGIGMRLRGVSSIKGNNQPLFIIDGVYMSNAEIPSGLRYASGANRGNEENSANRIADLNPNDIETIEVLKGASAAAIYGTRANAGVVIITTKSGKGGKTRVNLSQDFGINRIQNYMGVRSFTAQTVEDTYGEAEVQKYNEAVAAGEIFDYEEELYGETGFITSTNLSVSGGDERTSFYIAGSWRDEDGIVKGTGFERKSIRLNLEHQFNDRITIQSNSNFIRTDTDRGFTGNENEGGLSYGYNLAYTRPWVNLFPDEFGNYPDNPNAAGNMLLVRDLAENSDKVNRFIQGASLDIKIINQPNTLLRLKANGGLDYFVNETKVYVPEFHQAQRDRQNGFIGVGNNKFNNFNGQSFLIFDKFLDNNLALSTQAGISYLNFKRNLLYNQTTQLIPGQTNLTQGGSQSITEVEENEEEFGLIFQQEANFNDKLIATVGVRADKSSLNGDPNKYYGFYKGSLAINLTNFDFWASNTISQFKLRAAYGETGSSAGFGSLFTVFEAVNIGGNGGILIDPDRGTPNLIPETSAEIEAGFDLGFFGNRLGLEATYYNRTVNDLLFDRSLPASTGFTTEVLNDADLRNRGVELALLAKPIANNTLQWSSTTNFWLNRSEITRLGVPAFPPPGNGFGLGLGTFYIEEGAPITEIVQNVNGVPTGVGDAEPDFQISFFNELSFRNALEFSFLLHWKQGGENLNLTKLLTDDGGTSPEIDERGAQFADTYIEPAGYVRLREIALYYKLPKNSLFSGLNNVRIGISGRNIWTHTDYSGYDPEVSVNGSGVVSNGLDVGPYPSSKQYYFHINIGV